MHNFIHEFWARNRSHWNDHLVVRFPPEPNGHLHIGHAKALLTNAALVEAFGGRLIVRMDDTNPAVERPEFEHGILEDIAWLGVAHDPVVRRASDHFRDLHTLAEAMILAGEAYVDLSLPEAVAVMRGNFHTPGTPSACRSEPAEVHLARFRAMLEGVGEGRDGALRARMDMSNPSMVLRDPVLWRPVSVRHPRLPEWAALPTYDFAHPFCDLREEISLSLCSLEFEERKPLYNHIVERAVAHGLGRGKHPPIELEFARLDPDVGVTSKRVIKSAIYSGALDSWEDPRLLTLRGLRARGYTPEMIRRFITRLGVSRAASIAPMSWLDDEARGVLGMEPAWLVVEDPVRLRLTGDLPDTMTWKDLTLSLDGGREFWVGREDVRASSEADFLRLAPGHCVRLMGLGGVCGVERVECDDTGRIVAVEAHYLGPGKAKATVHVLPMPHALAIRVSETRTWDGKEPADDCVTTRTGMLLEGTDRATPPGLFHAPRVGWGSLTHDGTTWRKLCGMKRPAGG